jgi:hypothetical protein
MAILESFTRRAFIVLLAPAALLSCGRDINTSFPRPGEPLEATLYDLVTGPIERASAFNVVSGRGRGTPRTVRVDQSNEWDVAFAVLDGKPVWLPRGFFEGLEPSSGILELSRAFDEVTVAPENRELYEMEAPLPVTVGNTYIIRSRNDPTISLPCRIFAKVSVEAVGQDPDRVDLLFLWNPNCDDRNLTPGQTQ